jgi:hypothetical protein
MQLTHLAGMTQPVAWTPLLVQTAFGLHIGQGCVGIALKISFQCCVGCKNSVSMELFCT